MSHARNKSLIEISMGTIKEEEYKLDAGVYAIGVTKKELRVLSFWANVGLSKSKGGYQFELAKKMVKYFLKHTK